MCPSPPHEPKTEGLQIGDHRLNTSCGVVEWPDHHRGDDLVNAQSLCGSGGKQHRISFSLSPFKLTGGFSCFFF